MKQCCGTCKYVIYSKTQGCICANHKSEFVADFVEKEHYCEKFEENEIIKRMKPVPEEDRCQFCNNEATLLCDMPATQIVTHARGKGFNTKALTCDKQICTSCTTRVNEFDFCPDCVRKIKSAKKGVKTE